MIRKLNTRPVTAYRPGKMADMSKRHRARNVVEPRPEPVRRAPVVEGPDKHHQTDALAYGMMLWCGGVGGVAPVAMEAPKSPYILPRPGPFAAARRMCGSTWRTIISGGWDS